MSIYGRKFSLRMLHLVFVILDINWSGHNEIKKQFAHPLLLTITFTLSRLSPLLKSIDVEIRSFPVLFCSNFANFILHFFSVSVSKCACYLNFRKALTPNIHQLWLWLRLTWALVINGPLNLPKYRRGVMKICFAWSLDRRSIELDCLVRSDHRGGELRRRRWWRWPYSNNYLGRCCNNCFSAQLWLARRSQTIRQTANSKLCKQVQCKKQ